MTAITEEIRTEPGWRRWLKRRGWTAGVWLLLVMAILYYATLIPNFGAFQVSSIVKNSLPTAYLAIAQGVTVIAGGIDLGVGAIMVLSNAVSASLMEEQTFAMTILIGVAVIAGGAVLNGIVGWVITLSKVPDIVVTLATLFIFAGLALMVLPSPGGGTSEGFRAIFTGSVTGVGTNYVASIAAMAVPVVAVATWMSRSRTGLSLRARGSDANAAYLSGLSLMKTKVISYAIGGAFSALAGMSITAITNNGDARLSNALSGTLNSVAAVVLGGIALTGGVGSVIGALAAGVILFVLNPILTAMGIDPNTAQVIQGAIIVLVMMVAGVLEWRRRRTE